MTAPDKPVESSILSWQMGKRLAIWLVFFALFYLARDFFFLGFMTFLFSYIFLSIIERGMRRLSPGRESPRVRVLLTLAVFLITPLLLIGLGALVLPSMIKQCQHLLGWMSRISPESEVARVLEGYVGQMEFRRNYGDPTDPRYQKALADFRQTGGRFVSEYVEFPKLENWIEGGFSRQFADSQRGAIRSRLSAEGTSSPEFAQWFKNQKLPRLAQTPAANLSPPDASLLALMHANPNLDSDQLWQTVRSHPLILGEMRLEWIADATRQGMASAKNSPIYRQQLQAHFEIFKSDHPDLVPYTFDQFLTLQQARPQGPQVFAVALEKMNLPLAQDVQARVQTDFEATKKHELFQAWWSESSIAKFIRHFFESDMSGGAMARVEGIISSLLNIPLDLGSALLLSFLICIDFPRLKRAFGNLRETWLRDAYDEIVPAFASLGQLIGRGFYAQGLVALCNAGMMFLALNYLGVEHSLLLSGIIFMLCLVPTLGILIAWVILVVVALVQPGGGITLAGKVTAAVLVVVILEAFVFSPRILGRLMELHPVLIMVILPLAHYFFGLWGLLLAMPVAVYVINKIIFRRGLPGVEATATSPKSAVP